MIFDAESELMTAYIALITPIIPCFDGMAEESQTLPYAIVSLSGIDSDSKGSTKDSLAYNDVMVDIEVFTNYKGQKRCNELGNLILNAGYQDLKNSAIVLPNFSIIKTNHNTNPYGFSSIKAMKTPTGWLSRKRIQFKHNIIQKL